MTNNVIVVGGGYGGVAVAKALDEVARVVLVEPREAFLHNVAALRGAVDPAWTDRLFIPYGGLLAHGEVRRDRAVRVSARSGVTCRSPKRSVAGLLSCQFCQASITWTSGW